MKPGEASDVQIVGGGVIGLTAAYVLSESGLRVSVRDRGELGREASWAGAGILPPGNPNRAGSALDRLRAETAARFPAFSEQLHRETGLDHGYWRCGGVVQLEKHELGVLDLWRAEGIAFHRESDTRYALPNMAQVRNPRHVKALLAGCVRRGVELRPHTAWDGIIGPGQCVLIAAGAWSGELLKPFGVELPVSPVRGQIVLFKPERPVLERIVIVGKRYLVPRRDGRVLAGSTEEPEAGFAKANTPEGIESLKQFALGEVPALRSAEVESCWSGLRPGSPDGWPYIAAVPGVEGLFVAAGHFRAGIQQSIGTALLVRELIAGISSGLPRGPFALDRPTMNGVPVAFRS